MNPARVLPALDFARAGLAVLIFAALTSYRRKLYAAGSATSVRAGTGAPPGYPRSSHRHS